MLTGQLLDCPGEHELDRPPKFGRHVAHGHIVGARSRWRRGRCRWHRPGSPSPAKDQAGLMISRPIAPAPAFR
jgi:hypothetical protein